MSWGEMGCVTDARYMQPVQPRSRRRCGCGCKTRATHLGMANGVSLASGCELSMRRWVKLGLADPRFRPKPANAP